MPAPRARRPLDAPFVESAGLEIVVVHIGSRPPRYLHACLKQVQRVCGRPPVFIGPRVASRYSGSKLKAFRAAEKLSSFGLGGFWRYTCERFFVIEEHMRATGLSRCLHVESDNLVYVAPDSYEAWLDGTFGAGVAVCPLQYDLDTASVMYVGSLDALARLNEALLELVRMPPTDFVTAYGGDRPNEMRMLNVLRTQEHLCGGLPISPATARACGSAQVFDAGSYGQVVDGWYWEPGVPYVDDTHLVGGELSAGSIRLLWDARRSTPHVLDHTGDLLPLANLHVHSKRLQVWAPTPEARHLKAVGIPSEATTRARVRRAADRTLATASRLRQALSRRNEGRRHDSPE